MAATNKLEIGIKGKVFGFQNEDEDESTATARILLEAEMHGNAGTSRLHIEPTGTLPVWTNTKDVVVGDKGSVTRASDPQFCVIAYINNVEFTSQPVPQREAADLLQAIQTLNGVSNAWMTRADEIERLMRLKYKEVKS